MNSNLILPIKITFTPFFTESYTIQPWSIEDSLSVSCVCLNNGVCNGHKNTNDDGSEFNPYRVGSSSIAVKVRLRSVKAGKYLHTDGWFSPNKRIIHFC